MATKNKTTNKRRYLDDVTVLPELYVSPTSSGQYVAGYDSNGNRLYTSDKTKSMGYNGERPLQSHSNVIKSLSKKENTGKTWANIATAMIGTPLLVTSPAGAFGLNAVNKAINNPLSNAYFTYDAVRNSPSRIKTIYDDVLDKNYTNALGNTALLALDIKGAHDVKKGVQAATKRGVEVAMRTSPSSNPIGDILYGLRYLSHGEQGGLQRGKAIANYILTGKRTGLKGYYNSLARFRRSGDIAYYDGTIRNSTKGKEVNDIIDAYLYGKPIDEDVYNLKKVAQGENFGVHTDYINKNYSSKRKKIPVYEAKGTLKNFELYDELPKDYIPQSWEGAEHGFYTGTTDLNVGGHLMQVANHSRGTKYPMVRKQDIWKFNPKDYYKKWIEDDIDFDRYSPLQKALIYGGLKLVDAAGTPVVTRTKWTSHIDDALYGVELPFKYGGSIHIKPSHRGRLTELKARTGKSEAELYNDGNPAHKKMVVFARNARKWKH